MPSPSTRSASMPSFPPPVRVTNRLITSKWLVIDCRCDRADDARLVAALPRIHLSAPRGPGTGRPDPEASGRAVRAEPEGPGGVRMGPGHGPPAAAGHPGNGE